MLRNKYIAKTQKRISFIYSHLLKDFSAYTLQN